MLGTTSAHNTRISRAVQIAMLALLAGCNASGPLGATTIDLRINVIGSPLDDGAALASIETAAKRVELARSVDIGINTITPGSRSCELVFLSGAQFLAASPLGEYRLLSLSQQEPCRIAVRAPSIPTGEDLTGAVETALERLVDRQAEGGGIKPDAKPFELLDMYIMP